MRGERLCPSFAFMGYEERLDFLVLRLWMIVDLLLKVRTESVYQS